MAFRTSQGSGYVIDGTDSSGARDGIRQAPKIQALFEADDTISVGHLCAHDTGSTTGTLVVSCLTATADDHRFVGIYEGEGGSGSTTTSTGLSGKDAADGDFIWVTAYGKALGLCVGSGTAVVDGDPVAPSGATAGVILGLTSTQASGLTMPLIALEGHTGAAEGKAIFVKCM